MKLAAFSRNSWELLASRDGRWLVLFSLAIGVALAWTYVPLFLTPLRCGMGVALFDTSGVFSAYFVASAAVYALNAALGARPRVRALLGFGLPHALVGVIGGILLSCDNFLPGTVGALTGSAGAVLAAFSSTCAVLHASRLLKRLSPARAVVACTGAFVVAAAVTVCAAFVSGLPACLVVSLVPLATWALTGMSDERVPYEALATSGEKSLTLVPLRERDAWRYGAITLGLFLMGGWALNNAGQYDHLPQDLPALAVALQSVAVVAVFALAAAMLQSSERPLGYDLICRTCVPVIALAILLEFMPENNAGYLDDLAVCLSFVALLLSDLTAWVIDVCAMRGRGAADGRAFSIMRAMTCVGVLLSHVVVYGIKWTPLDKPKVAMTVGFLMLIVTIVCLPTANAKVLPVTNARPTPLRDLPDEQRKSLAGLVVAHGLTAREAEVLALLADGLDAAAIARELGVSGSTVHTHVIHVYGKLDVHSRKELDRLLAEARR